MGIGIALSGPGMWTVFVENYDLFLECLLHTFYIDKRTMKI